MISVLWFPGYGCRSYVDSMDGTVGPRTRLLDLMPQSEEWRFRCIFIISHSKCHLTSLQRTGNHVTFSPNHHHPSSHHHLSLRILCLTRILVPSSSVSCGKQSMTLVRIAWKWSLTHTHTSYITWPATLSPQTLSPWTHWSHPTLHAPGIILCLCECNMRLCADLRKKNISGSRRKRWDQEKSDDRDDDDDDNVSSTSGSHLLTVQIFSF